MSLKSRIKQIILIFYVIQLIAFVAYVFWSWKTNLTFSELIASRLSLMVAFLSLEGILMFEWFKRLNTDYVKKIYESNIERDKLEKLEQAVKQKGKLQIIDIIPYENKIEGICELEFQVKNIGGLNVFINHVNFKLLDIYPPNGTTLGIREYMNYSHGYDLDISSLKQIGDTIDCRVAQIIKSDNPDRFKIILIAKDMKMGEFRRWKLEPKLLTDSGDEVLGKPVEVWLPYILKEYTKESIDKMYKDLESLEKDKS